MCVCIYIYIYIYIYISYTHVTYCICEHHGLPQAVIVTLFSCIFMYIHIYHTNIDLLYL